MTQLPLSPRPAATLILVRDGAQGLEVFLMQRTLKASFMAGAYVFPGGAVDAADASELWETHDGASNDASISRTLDVERGGLAYLIAAIRECFEESGLLLARDAQGRTLALRDAAIVEEFSALRKKMNAGEVTLADICSANRLQLTVDELMYYAHWITPPGSPRRFDTRFFVAVAPPEQTPTPDGTETIDHVWIRPADALERRGRGEMIVAFPTGHTLEQLAAFPDTKALMEHGRSGAVLVRAPWPSTGRDGRKMLLPEDPPYAEARKLDPVGTGNVAAFITPGEVVQLSNRVRRITAPNPGFMTGPGTNSYLVGAGGDIAVIDPGPALDAHVQTLIAEGGARIRWILTTHTHMDHSPAACLLKALTGAELLGMPPPDFERQDQSFRPDRILRHGERIALDGCTLRVIHTPGHASNHLCYLLEEEQLLFTGDHIMQGSTVVINPPDGDMGVYLASLRLLQEENTTWLAPGHGFLMDRPLERIERLLGHRLARESKVFDALRQRDAAAIEELLPLVYDDVPAQRHVMAARSLLAHLLKLRADGAVAEKDGQWSLA
ncbi:MAG: MBL fold metallo-hydrolase [Pseudomonadota bacterium]